ncbi:MAG: DUF1361 domain-containing protein [Spirochaetales bacterium]
MKPSMRLNSPVTSLVLFLLALGGCLAMLGVRYLLTGSLSQVFLARNLFLGLVPLAIAFVALLVERQNWKVISSVLLWLCSVVWVVFFPNSSYIFTDFIHLIQRGLPDDGSANTRSLANMLVWYDIITRSLFAFVGHFLGLASLYVMHHLWKKEVGPVWGGLLVGVSCLAAGYGVFIGRFVRWSSWHLFTNFDETWNSLMENLTAPDALVFSIGFGIFLAVSYFFVYVFKKHLFALKET